MDVDPVSKGGVWTDKAEVMINPGHLCPALPTQAAEETQAATEQESIVDLCYPAGSPHLQHLSPLTSHLSPLTSH